MVRVVFLYNKHNNRMMLDNYFSYWTEYLNSFPSLTRETFRSLKINVIHQCIILYSWKRFWNHYFMQLWVSINLSRISYHFKTQTVFKCQNRFCTFIFVWIPLIVLIPFGLLTFIDLFTLFCSYWLVTLYIYICYTVIVISFWRC